MKKFIKIVLILFIIATIALPLTAQRIQVKAEAILESGLSSLPKINILVENMGNDGNRYLNKYSIENHLIAELQRKIPRLKIDREDISLDLLYLNINFMRSTTYGRELGCVYNISLAMQRKVIIIENFKTYNGAIVWSKAKLVCGSLYNVQQRIFEDIDSLILLFADAWEVANPPSQE